jgi:hypothetical protein
LLEFDLQEHAGRRVRLRFLFGSDNVATPFGVRGWALDDFRVEPGQRLPTDTPGWGPNVVSLLRHAPWPNPSGASVRFDLLVPPRAGPLRLEIIDARGRRVASLLEDDVQPGPRSIVWVPEEGRQPISAGLYHYRLVSSLGVETGKLVLLR